MRILYDFSIRCYSFAIHIASCKSKKAKLWLQGRKNVFHDLRSKCKDKDNIIWFHCASLGEFEQGRSLIEIIKKEKPEFTLLLTFFSPSGYEIRKNYASADIITYLPADTIHNAKKFLSIVKPKYIFFIKYEYWFNYINEAYNQHIPFYVVSAIFRENQRFFAWYGKWFRKELSKITYFFTQNETSKRLLNDINISQCEVFGDTRLDTVSELVPLKDPRIEKFCADKRTFIAGSTWLEDEKILETFIKNHDIKWIIAPHEIDEAHLQQIKSIYRDCACVFYTDVDENTDLNSSKIMIINVIGILRKIYHYGEIAYIGGGFGKGIHNILEAATFGKPIVFGPNYHRFKEACDLIEKEAAFPVHTDKELCETMDKLIQNPLFLSTASHTVKEYIDSQKGASQKIVTFVFKK